VLLISLLGIPIRASITSNFRIVSCPEVRSAHIGAVKSAFHSHSAHRASCWRVVGYPEKSLFIFQAQSPPCICSSWFPNGRWCILPVGNPIDRHERKD
jgi:hypothetical protein